MSISLEILNTTATNIVEFTGLNPFSFFMTTIILASLIILADLKSGFSVSIPGRGQLGLAGAVFVLGAFIMILAAEGYQFFFIEVAKSTISLLGVSVFIAWILGRQM